MVCNTQSPGMPLVLRIQLRPILKPDNDLEPLPNKYRTLWVSRLLKYPKKYLEDLTTFFQVYLMWGFQKYERNWILTMAFWVTCKIAQPIQPIWQHIFALPWSALKKPSWEFNFFHNFGIPSSSRPEKCCQILQKLFWVFQYSRNSQCQVMLYAWASLIFYSIECK